MKNPILHAILTLGFLFLGFTTAQACTCGGPSSPYRAFQGAKAVFVGTVREIVTPDTAGRADVIFDVQEAFKGVTGGEVKLSQGYGGDCVYGFKKDQTYLVYALAGNSGLYAFTCGRTAMLRYAPGDLKCMRNVSGGVRTLSVFGTIRRGNSYRGDGLPPIAGGKVVVENREPPINSDGSFYLENVPPGVRKLKIFLPDSLSPSYLERPLDLTESICQQQDFAVQVNGVIEGKIFETDNTTPAADIPVKLVKEPGRPYGIAETRTDENGFFTFTKIMPGEYFIIAVQDSFSLNRRISFPNVFYPGTIPYTKPDSIKLGYAEKLSNANIRLLPKPAERLIEGRIVREDGTPVGGARISYEAINTIGRENPHSPYAYSAENGRFFISVLENTQGLISASGITKDGNYFTAKSVFFDENNVPKTVKLIVPR
jgi:hypothetical protein